MNSCDLNCQNLVERVQGDLCLMLGKWKEHFAKKLDDNWHDFLPRFDHDISELPDSIKDIVNTVKGRINSLGNRNGEASLFIRDPREDRLVLTYSTSGNLNKGTADLEQVKDPSHYYDASLNRYIYPLCDTLANNPQERRSEDSKRMRGLTGWVAVTGHHLLINGEYGDLGLNSIAEDRPETLSMCHTYGHPIWGRHISEAPSKPGRQKRYVAVPVKSSFDPECTIGVLRYSCPRNGAELHSVDAILMSELAQIISAMFSLEDTTKRNYREILFQGEVDVLQGTYNLSRFLRFIANSLQSSISSLYIDIGEVCSPKTSMLRLFDAFGIKDPVGQIRERISDYLEGDKGFTRWVFDNPSREPIVMPSVHTHRNWEGKNTELFYGRHFERLQPGGDYRNEAVSVARKYTIKIVGLPIYFNESKIGVLKVELPTRYDADRHYGHRDQIFLKDCAKIFGPILNDFKKFITQLSGLKITS